MKRHWNTYSDYLAEKYGGRRVYRVSVDAGLSCPNRDALGRGGCAFCDGTGGTAVHLRPQEKDLKESQSLLLKPESDIAAQIDRGLKYIRYRYKAELAMLYFQSWSNTNAPAGRLKKLYDMALERADFVSLIVSTRPDLLSDEVLDLLASYRTDKREVWVEAGLQSADDDTLRRLGRGHDAACFADAAQRIHAHGLKLCTHMMILPCYENLEKSIETIRFINRCASDAVKIHNLCLTRGTRLLDDYKSLGCYPVLSLERFVHTAAVLLAHLDRSVVVERLMSEMTASRLVNPLHFPDKRDVLELVDLYMENRGWQQGCLSDSI